MPLRVKSSVHTPVLYSMVKKLLGYK